MVNKVVVPACQATQAGGIESLELNPEPIFVNVYGV